MSKFILSFSALAMILSMMICISHAHASINSDTEISVNIDVDDKDNDSMQKFSEKCCITCGGCTHHIINSSLGINDMTLTGSDRIALSDLHFYVSELIYGLKRPPKA